MVMYVQIAALRRGSNSPGRVPHNARVDTAGGRDKPDLRPQAVAAAGMG